MKKYFFLMVLVIVALIALFPTILSTKMGNAFLITAIEKRYGGTLQADSLQFSWTGSQEAKQIVYKRDNVLISAVSIYYSDSFPSLFFKKAPKTGRIENCRFIKDNFHYKDVQLVFDRGSISASGQTKSKQTFGNFSISSILEKTTNINQIEVTLNDAPLINGKSLSTKAHINPQTGEFTLSRIKYGNDKIADIKGIYQKGKLNLHSKFKGIPFSLKTVVHPDTSGIHFLKPTTIKGINSTPLLEYPEDIYGEISPFFISYSKGLTKPVDFQFSTKRIPLKYTSLKNPSLKGSFTLEGLTARLSADNAHVNLSKEGKTWKFKSKKFPSAAFALHFIGSNKLSFNGTYTGGQLDVDFSGKNLAGKLTSEIHDLSGPFTLEINSKTLKTRVHGKLENGTLKLRRSLTAKFMLNKRMKDLIWNDFNIQILDSRTPSVLKISEDKFTLRLFPFDLKSLKVKSGKLDVGKISVTNEGVFKKISRMLEKNRDYSSDLWIGPMDFTIHNGKMQIMRTDILYEKSSPLALWGKVHLDEKRVSLIIGLSAEALEKAFNITKLPEDYYFHISVNGEFGNIKYDTKKTALKFLLLMADKKLIPKFRKNWGENPGESISAPFEKPTPPSRRSFPWR